MKKDFINNENINSLFKTIEEQTEEEKKPNEEIIPEEDIKLQEEKEPSKAVKNSNKKETEKKPQEKKFQIFSEVDQIVFDYLNLKTIVTGKSKKEILEEMFFDEIIETFELKKTSSDEELHETMKKAIQKKMNQIEQMKSLFK